MAARVLTNVTNPCVTMTATDVCLDVAVLMSDGTSTTREPIIFHQESPDRWRNTNTIEWTMSANSSTESIVVYPTKALEPFFSFEAKHYVPAHAKLFISVGNIDLKNVNLRMIGSVVSGVVSGDFTIEEDEL